MKKFKAEYIIDRSKWRCGRVGNYAKGLGNTLLLNEQGFMCCLGQISIQENLDIGDIINQPDPQHISKEIPNLSISKLTPNIEYYSNTEFSRKAMLINDDKYLNTSERERALKKLASEYNIKLKFINKSIPFTCKK